jgi:ABC-type branched-subunit amino acid transport system substrate-binding protein
MRFFLFMFFSTILLFGEDLEVGFVYWKKDDAPEKYNSYVFGIEKAIEEINKKEIFEQKIKLIQFNEKGDVEESKRIAKEIANRKNMISVIGFSNSKRAIEAIQSVSEAKIPIISSAGSRKVFENDPNNIFFSTNFGIMGEILYLQKFIKEKNYQNFVFISVENDKYSEEYFDELNKIIPNQKKILLSSRDSNLSENQVSEISNSLSENSLIVISVDVKNNAKTSKIIRENEIKNDIFLGRGGIVGDEFYDFGGKDLKNIYELSTLLAGVSNDKILEFKLNNREFFDEKHSEYLEYSTYGYDVMNLLIYSYINSSTSKNNSVSEIRQKIVEGLLKVTEKLPYDGISTIYSFDKNRIGGKLTPQYILKTTGIQPSLYKQQFIYQNGILSKVPTLFTNIDVKSLSVANQEASEYRVELMITLISEANISLDDLEFENILISDSSFVPSIYSKEFIVSENHGGTLNTKIYNVKAEFKWSNTIEEFPFDSQKLPILIKPKDPINSNFINFFISDIDKNLHQLTTTGWYVKGGYAGFQKGNYEFVNQNFEVRKEYYYRSSFTIDIERKALGSAIKFILPLVIVLIITLVLFLLPDNAVGDKVGSGTNMLITVAALYFTYATLVDVDYITFVDKFYMLSLAFVLMSNILFILRQRFYHDGELCFSGGKILSWTKKGEKQNKKQIKYNNIYSLTFVLSILMFIGMIALFFYKAI